MKRLLLAVGVACAALASAPVRAEVPTVRHLLSRTWIVFTPVEAEVASGYSDGWWGRSDVSGGLTTLAAEVAPTVRYSRGRFLASLPLAVSHRETFGFDLRETELDGGLLLSRRLADGLTVEARAEAEWTLRPDWPDQYQPVLQTDGEPSGELRPTDRYTHRQLGAELSVAWELRDDLELEAAGGFDRRVYEKDPAFDAILAPTHLVPGDRSRGWAELDLDGKVGVYRYGFDARVEVLDYDFELARDAGTGLTHGPVGGPPPNPLLREVRLSVDHRSSVWVRALDTRFTAELGYAHNEDTFDGYYTWNELEVGLAGRWRAPGPLVVEVSWDLDRRWYTSDGYGEGGSHPPLEDGAAVREGVRHDLQAELSLDLADGALEPFVSGRWRVARTSFPDYEPRSFPPSGAYDIDFDWTQVLVMAGLRVDL